MCPTIFADVSTGLSIEAAPTTAPKAVPKTSRHVRAQRLRPAILPRWPHNRQRARIQRLARRRFPLLKAQHQKRLSLVSVSTPAKWAERRARAAMVGGVREHLSGRLYRARNGCG